MQQGLSYVTALQLQKVSGRLQADAGAELYAHLQALPLEWHNARQRGDVLALLYVDIYRIGRYVTGTLLPLLPLLFTLVGALAMMLHLAPPIAVMVAVLMPLMFLALKWVGRKLRPLSHASAQAWAEQSSLAEQNLESLALIKAFGTEAVERANFRQRADTVYATDLRPVSYTHLDVYKRQILEVVAQRLHPMSIANNLCARCPTGNRVLCLRSGS